MRRAFKWVRAGAARDLTAERRPGGEQFLGETKVLSVPSAIVAWAKVGVVIDGEVQGVTASAATRVSRWAQANPGVNSCFEF
jgi:hypothetical protein